MLVIDVFKYFARFVPVDVLRKSFRVPSRGEYANLMNELLAGPSGREIEGITEYIFGSDPDKVTSVISSVTGIYLFVEYDRITSDVDIRTDRKEDRMHIAVTVACPIPDSIDLVSAALKQDRCLEILSSIRRHLREDDDLMRGVAEWMDFPATLTVFSSKALANSQGWSMEFDIKTIDQV